MRETSDYFIFAGSSHPSLSQKIASHLSHSLGKVDLHRFPDGELGVQIQESVRGKHTFVIQSVARQPNEHLMELLIMIDALSRASAKSIVAVIPYFGYCRQDRKDKPRVPITAKLVANLLTTAGASRVLTMDLHTGQIQGFFDIPVDNIPGSYELIPTVKKELKEPFVVVAPDIGSIKLARSYADTLGVDMAVADKQRRGDEDVSTMAIIGDVNGKHVLLTDDMCSTGSTLVAAAKACLDQGAIGATAVITHGLFTNNSLEKLSAGPIDRVYVSDTIPMVGTLPSSFEVVSIASSFSRSIERILTSGSIQELFDY